MRITVNGQLLDLTVRTDSLDALLEDVRRALPNEQLIAGVLLNGRRLAEADFAEELSRPVPSDAQLDFETGSRQSLVAQALHDLGDELAAAADDQRWAAERLETGDASAGIQQVGGFVKVWQSCRVGILQANALLEADLTQRNFEHRPVTDHLSSLTSCLDELREALANRDTVLLADLLRSSVPEACETWAALLHGLSREIESEVASAEGAERAV